MSKQPPKQIRVNGHVYVLAEPTKDSPVPPDKEVAYQLWQNLLAAEKDHGPLDESNQQKLDRLTQEFAALGISPPESPKRQMIFPKSFGG